MCDYPLKTFIYFEFYIIESIIVLSSLHAFEGLKHIAIKQELIKILLRGGENIKHLLV